MRSTVTTALAAAFLLLAPVASHAALTPYSQNFEALNQAAPDALANDGWLIFANVFTPDHTGYIGGYGVFPAPNNTGGFCGIDFTSDPGQAAQDMVVYSDYNNGTEQSAGNQVEANVFHEQTIGASDVGSTWTFQFDAKLGNLQSPSTALAFIKTLDPNAGYATTNFLTLDTTTIPATFMTYAISINITPGLVGQLLQFGFSATASNYVPSGVFYDNIDFRNDTATPAAPSSWGRIKSLFR
jgi:hypothetical protein